MRYYILGDPVTTKHIEIDLNANPTPYYPKQANTIQPFLKLEDAQREAEKLRKKGKKDREVALKTIKKSNQSGTVQQAPLRYPIFEIDYPREIRSLDLHDAAIELIAINIDELRITLKKNSAQNTLSLGSVNTITPSATVNIPQEFKAAQVPHTNSTFFYNRNTLIFLGGSTLYLFCGGLNMTLSQLDHSGLLPEGVFSFIGLSIVLTASAGLAFRFAANTLERMVGWGLSFNQYLPSWTHSKENSCVHHPEPSAPQIMITPPTVAPVIFSQNSATPPKSSIPSSPPSPASDNNSVKKKTI